MKKELEEKLILNSLNLFGMTGKKTTKWGEIDIWELINPLPLKEPIQFGIACGEGWYDLIDDLLTSIKRYIEYKPEIPFRITQIKSKFGGLRFYYKGGDDVIQGMVQFAQSFSYRICEKCGTTKNIGYTPYQTICKECWEKHTKFDETKWKSRYEDIML